MKPAIVSCSILALYAALSFQARAAEITCASSELPEAFNGTASAPLVVPGVSSWRSGEGAVRLTAGSRIRVDAPDNAELMRVANQFSQQLQRVSGLQLQVSGGDPAAGDILLSLASCSGTTAASSDEGYTLAIGQPVTLRASHPAGLFYATQTLLQMATLQQDRTSLPRGYVADTPRYQERSIMFDVGRKFASVDFLTAYIKFMGWYKLNTLHLHLNDQALDAGGQWGLRAFRLKSDNPQFASLVPADGQYYTRQDWNKLEQVAADYGVRIVPEIDSPGHAGAFALGNPEIAYAGDNPPGGTIDPRRPETLAYIKSVFDEFLPWFRSSVVHIGGDEVNVNNGAIPVSSQVRYLNDLAHYLQSKGKTVQMWGDQSYLPALDKNVWIQRWINWGSEASINWKQKGYRWTESYGDWYIVPKTNQAYFNPNGLTGERVYNKWPANDVNPPIGAQISVWNDNALTRQYTWEQDVNRLLSDAIPAAGQIFWRGKAQNAQGATLEYSSLRPSVGKLQYGPDVTQFSAMPLSGG